MASIAVTQATFQTDVVESPVPVLVDLWAPWCGPCRQVGPILEQMSEALGAWLQSRARDNELEAALYDNSQPGNLQGGLDDVMRLMWQRKGETGAGLQEDEFSGLVMDATGVDLHQQIQQWTQSTVELPLAAALKGYGYSLQQATGEEAIYLGTHGVFRPEGMLVKQVINGSPAHIAGISAGDVLFALGEKKLTESNYKRLLASTKPGTALHAIGFRAERLMTFNITAGEPVSNDWSIKKLEQIEGKTVPAPWLAFQAPQ